jgi:hypothetical protein
VLTVVVTSAVYVVIAAAFASASLAGGAAIGAAAGTLRGATLLAGGTVRSPRALLHFHTRVQAWSGRVRLGALAGQAALLAFAIGTLAS